MQAFRASTRWLLVKTIFASPTLPPTIDQARGLVKSDSRREVFSAAAVVVVVVAVVVLRSRSRSRRSSSSRGRTSASSTSSTSGASRVVGSSGSSSRVVSSLVQ